MAAYNDTKTISAGTVSELTDSDATTVSVQPHTDAIWIKGSANSTAPAWNDGKGWFRIPTGSISAGLTLTDLFPGVSSVARLFGYIVFGETKVTVSHD